MILQLVFLIAIYQVFFRISRNNLTVDPTVLYSFVSDPGKINNLFIGIIDLAKSSIPLAILAAAAQFYQTKMLMAKQKPAVATASKTPDFANIMNKQMLYMGPALTLFIGIKFPAGLALYWLVSTLFAIGQQMYLEKKLPFFQKKMKVSIVPKK
jgi:YidC/Oxa1 family membrane protein insertase